MRASKILVSRFSIRRAKCRMRKRARMTGLEALFRIDSEFELVRITHYVPII